MIDLEAARTFFAEAEVFAITVDKRTLVAKLSATLAVVNPK